MLSSLGIRVGFPPFGPSEPGRRGVARPVFTWLPHAWQIAVALSHQLRASLAVIADSEGRSARVGPVVFSGTCTEHCLAESAGYWRVKAGGWAGWG